MWKGSSLLNDPLNNGIGMCLYEVHVCHHEITYMLRLVGSTLMFGISLAPCCVFVHIPCRHAERCIGVGAGEAMASPMLETCHRHILPSACVLPIIAREKVKVIDCCLSVTFHDKY